MRSNLINIAFFLEPAVDELIAEWVSKEEKKYTDEHSQNNVFYNEVVESEK
jgi:hypothetical protein